MWGGTTGRARASRDEESGGNGGQSTTGVRGNTVGMVDGVDKVIGVRKSHERKTR